MGNANSAGDIKLKVKHSASYSNLNKKFNIYDKCNNLPTCDSIRRKKKSKSTSNLAHLNSSKPLEAEPNKSNLIPNTVTGKNNSNKKNPYLFFNLFILKY